MLLKIGIRKNMRYPLGLILFNSLLDLDEIFMRLFCKYYKGYFILCFLIFLSQFLSGLIPLILFKCKNRKKTKKKNINGFKLIEGIKTIKHADSIYRILLLLFFAAYFNLIGTIVRRKYFSQINKDLPERDHFMEHRFKSIQIQVSALLSYLALKMKIYKHQKVSLITILIFLILIIIIDIIDDHPNLSKKIKYFLLSAFSNIARSFLDTIEKYLFDFNFLRPCSILLYEGIIGAVFFPLLLFIDNDSYEDLREIKTISNDSKTKYFLLIIFFIFFLIINAFKNIYRVLTIQYYSSMTRALAESILDPFVLIYYFCLIEKKELNDSIYFVLIILCLLIIAFCSLVYNDFIILYFCGMEKNTYLEINKRSYNNLNNAILNENDSDSDENDNNDDNVKLNNELNLQN